MVEKYLLYAILFLQSINLSIIIFYGKKFYNLHYPHYSKEGVPVFMAGLKDLKKAYKKH